MEYRRLPKGTEEIGVIGFGGSGLHEAGETAGAETVLAAMERGVNYFDMAVSEAAAFKSYRAAFAGRRERVYLQMHFGADYSFRQYGWTTDVGRIKRGTDWLLRELDTDYIDFGFIHCIDQAADLEKYINSGALAHIQKLKEEGVVRHIGLSSHTPSIVNRLLDMGILDVVMFSINPAYDYRHGDYAFGGVDERESLYCRCQTERTDGGDRRILRNVKGGQRHISGIRSGLLRGFVRIMPFQS